MLVALTGALALGALAAGPAAAEGACANEALRRERGLEHLPDCRAYELVSPALASAEGGGTGVTQGARAAVAGSGIAWRSYYPPPNASAGGHYLLSTRAPARGQWVTQSLVPPQSAGSQFNFACQPSMFFSPSLGQAVLSDGWESIGRSHETLPYCPHNEPAIVSGPEPEGFQNLFLRDNTTGDYGLVNLTETVAPPGNAYFEAASTEPGAEFSRVIFEERAQLTTAAEESPEGEHLYEYAAGSVRMVSILPDGTAVLGQLVNGVPAETREENATVYGEADEPTGNSAAQFTHAFARNGERVIFTYAGRIYMRVNAMQPQSALSGERCTEPAKACTVTIDPSGEGVFLWANTEGTKVVFSDTEAAELTEDTEAGSGVNLYEYSLPPGAVSGKLTDLTPYQHAEVDGLSGISEDGTTVYFVADAVLPRSGATSQGDCSPPLKANESYECNLYVTNHGTTRYIATVEVQNKLADWGGSNEAMTKLTARVSPNGRFLAFDAKNGLATSQIWRYDASNGTLACASCAASGQVVAEATILPPQKPGNEAGPLYLNHYVLNDGRVFFQTVGALVSADANGASDVYEYSGGAPHLISSGSNPSGAYYVDVSEGGEHGPATDVFFDTSASLVRSDPGTGSKVYDARVDGGFAEPAPAPACGEAECRPAGAASAFSAPASVSFSGLGNLKPPAAKRKTTEPKKGSGGKAKAQRRRKRLHRALKLCRHLFRHNRHRRRACKRRARRRYGARAKGARRHRHRHHHSGRRHHRHRHHHGGGAR